MESNRKKTSILTLTAAAKRKNCSCTTLFRLIKRGKIRTIEAKGHCFIVNDELFGDLQLPNAIRSPQQIEQALASLEEENRRLKWEKYYLVRRVKELETLLAKAQETYNKSKQQPNEQSIFGELKKAYDGHCRQNPQMSGDVPVPYLFEQIKSKGLIVDLNYFNELLLKWVDENLLWVAVSEVHDAKQNMVFYVRMKS